MRPIAFLLSILLLAPLAGCLTLGGSTEETAPDSMGPQQQAMLFEPEPGLTPRERYRKSLSLLESGEAGRARAELQAYLREAPDGRYAKRSRGLLRQIDADPKAELGEEYFLYTMQSGDSLSSVSKRYLDDALKFYVLARYNDLDNPSQVDVGQTIRVPGQRPPDVPEIEIAEPEAKPEPESDPTQIQEGALPKGGEIPATEDDVPDVVPTEVEDGEGEGEIESKEEEEDFKIRESEVEGLQTVMTKAQDMASAGDFEGAANVLEDGMVKYPDDELMPKFAAANYITLASQYSANEQYDRAEEYLKRAAVLDPQNPDIGQSRLANFVAQADRARGEGRPDDERELLIKALEFDRENEDVRGRLSDNLLAKAEELRGQGLREEERDALTMALKLDPDNSSVRDRLVDIQRFEEANDLFKVGQEYQNANQNIDAYDSYEKALAIFPDHEPAQDAREKLKPEVVDFYYKKGKQAFSREQLKEAIDWFDKALEINPDHSPSELTRNQAIEIQNALEKIPDDG